MSKPNILVLSLMDEDYLSDLFQYLMSSMRAVATVKQVTRVKEARALLSAKPPPDGVLSIDAGPSEAKNRALNEELVKYAKAGGTVVFGGNFSNHFSLNTATRFFAAWGVPWTLGDYHRTEVHLSSSGVTGMDLAGLDPSYSVKALNLSNVAASSAVYTPSSTSRTQSHVFAPAAVDESETPAAYIPVGKGYMGYTGDVNAEGPTTKTLMAMLHLPIDRVGPDTTDRVVGIRFENGVMKQIRQSEMNAGNTGTGGACTAPQPTPTPSRSHAPASDQAPYQSRTAESTLQSFQSQSSEHHRTVHPTPRAIPSRNLPPLPRPREAEVKARSLRRAKTAKKKKIAAEKLKEKGNNVFKNGHYGQAVDFYKQACTTYKPLPLWMSNLTAALLKLERWEEAEHAATYAILGDQNLLKARFRRGLARKALGKTRGAVRDFEHCLVLDSNCAEARTELEQAIAKREPLPEDQRFDTESVDEICMDFTVGPNFVPGRAALVLECPSDSEDYKHVGKLNRACRYYNHDGCQFGTSCRYNHKTDLVSVRDELGRNVCLHFLIDRCLFGEACWYSHDKTYLPSNGWWNSDDLDQYRGLYDELRELGEDRPMNNLLGGDMNGTVMPWVTRSKLKKFDEESLGLNDRDSDEYDEEDSDAEGNPFIDIMRARVMAEAGGFRPSTMRGASGRNNTRRTTRMEREMEERAENYGFTEDEVQELLCQGVKPWDDDAHAVMDVLNGHY